MIILIQLTNGRRYRCALGEEGGKDDKEREAEFFEKLKYWEIFDQNMLRVHHSRNTWAIHPGFIEKIHFVTAADSGVRPPGNIVSSKCITAENFRQKLKALDEGDAPVQQVAEGKVVRALVKITLASGALEYFEFMLMLGSPREMKANMSILFQRVSYPIPAEGGGYVLFNPKNIACINLQPAPAENADSAWVIDQLEESGTL